VGGSFEGALPPAPTYGGKVHGFWREILREVPAKSAAPKKMKEAQ